VSAISDFTPSPQRQHLAAALRRRRLDTNLTGEQLAQRIDISQSKLSRIELGQSAPSTAEVDRWARETHATQAQREELLAQAEAIAAEVTNWRKAVRRGLPRLQQEVRELEVAAGSIHNFSPVLIPGLLQTAGYVQQIMKAGLPAGRPDIAAAVQARLERQVILYEEAKRLEFIVAEAALRWRPGPVHIQLEQLDRISNVATLPGVSIGIIPLAAEVTVWHTHGFNLFDDRTDEGNPVVLVETLTRGLALNDPEDVSRYREALEQLRKMAVFGEEAQRLLRAVMADLRQTAG